MTGKSRDAPKRAGKSKQTEPAETMPRDVGEFVVTVAHEVQSIARLARGLCEADASQEGAALIKHGSRVSDEGVDDASKSLLDRPLGEILQKKNVHVAEDEAVLSVGILATVIESRLNILHEFAQAVQERSILGTPEGLQYLDKHRTAHYPRIVPLVEPTAGYRQLVEEIEQLKEENALIQQENDELAHDLGKREAEAEFNSVSSSGQSRRHLPKVRSRAFIERLILLLCGLFFGALFTGFGWWVAHLQSQRAAFEAGRADQAIELRHVAEVNASESGRLVEAERANAAIEKTLRMEAEQLADAKMAIAEERMEFVATMKSVSREIMERAHQELMGFRAQDADQVAGEPFAALRAAGEIMRRGGLDDPEMSAYYANARSEVVLQLVRFLWPDEQPNDVLAALRETPEQ